MAKPYTVGDKIRIIRPNWTGVGEVVKVFNSSNVANYQIRGNIVNQKGYVDWSFDLYVNHNEIMPENRVTKALFGVNTEKE